MDLTWIDTQGRHWDPDGCAWPLQGQSTREREFPQEPRQLAVGKVWQSFTLNADETPRGAYAIN